MLTRRSDNGVWITANDSPGLLGAAAAEAAAEGERRLLIAVLVHALRSLFRDAEKPGRGALRRLRQDLRWLTSPDRSDLFTFERICEAIGVDAARIRQHVLDELGAVTQLLEARPARTRRSRVSLADPLAAPARIDQLEPVRAVG
jgi:hypothetical protein